MDVLRVAPYPITINFPVPAPNTTYRLYIEDLIDHSYENITLTSDSNSRLIWTIPLSRLLFDRKFLTQIYDITTGDILFDDNLDILRPYTDPNLLGTTPDEIAEYKVLEFAARSIIDDVVVDGFYNRKMIIQTVGQGLDYIPTWAYVNKILQVYENDILVYDSSRDPSLNINNYKIILDNSGIQMTTTSTDTAVNRYEQKPADLPMATGDLGFYQMNGTSFPKGWDYTIIADVGYKTVPSDIQYATELLIKDLKNGNLDYFNRYVDSYTTDQYSVTFNSKRIYDGVGNLVVDKILDKYVNYMSKPSII
jgi:hypothetical protein